MSYKIFTKGNYFLIQDNDTDVEFEGLSKNVRVRRLTTSSDNFFFDNVNNWKDKKTGVNIADIQDEAGTPYTLQGFIDWYRANTGNFNGGGAAPDLTGYATEEWVEDNFIPLTGTEVGNPVTGLIKFGYVGDDNYGGIGTNPNTDLPSIMDENNDRSVTYDSFINNGVVISVDSSYGLRSTNDHSANYEDFSYVQKIYVDNAIANIVFPPKFSEIVIEAETDGIEIPITGGVYMVYNFKGQTVYRYMTTATNANGYNIEDSFYATLTAGVLSDKITQRNQ